jgi:hypothetical protein
LSSVVRNLKPSGCALAITSATRSALMPELPTFAEAGLNGYEVTGWYGVLVRAGTPRDHPRLHAGIAQALAQADGAGAGLVRPRTRGAKHARRIFRFPAAELPNGRRWSRHRGEGGLKSFDYRA